MHLSRFAGRGAVSTLKFKTHLVQNEWTRLPWTSRAAKVFWKRSIDAKKMFILPPTIIPHNHREFETREKEGTSEKIFDVTFILY